MSSISVPSITKVFQNGNPFNELSNSCMATTVVLGSRQQLVNEKWHKTPREGRFSDEGSTKAMIERCRASATPELRDFVSSIFESDEEKRCFIAMETHANLLYGDHLANAWLITVHRLMKKILGDDADQCSQKREANKGKQKKGGAKRSQSRALLNQTTALSDQVYLLSGLIDYAHIQKIFMGKFQKIDWDLFLKSETWWITSAKMIKIFKECLQKIEAIEQIPDTSQAEDLKALKELLRVRIKHVILEEQVFFKSIESDGSRMIFEGLLYEVPWGLVSSNLALVDSPLEDAYPVVEDFVAIELKMQRSVDTFFGKNSHIQPLILLNRYISQAKGERYGRQQDRLMSESYHQSVELLVESYTTLTKPPQNATKKVAPTKFAIAILAEMQHQRIHLIVKMFAESIDSNRFGNYKVEDVELEKAILQAAQALDGKCSPSLFSKELNARASKFPPIKRWMDQTKILHETYFNRLVVNTPFLLEEFKGIVAHSKSKKFTNVPGHEGYCIVDPRAWMTLLNRCHPLFVTTEDWMKEWHDMTQNMQDQLVVDMIKEGDDDESLYEKISELVFELFISQQEVIKIMTIENLLRSFVIDYYRPEATEASVLRFFSPELMDLFDSMESESLQSAVEMKKRDQQKQVCVSAQQCRAAAESSVPCSRDKEEYQAPARREKVKTRPPESSLSRSTSSTTATAQTTTVEESLERNDSGDDGQEESVYHMKMNTRKLIAKMRLNGWQKARQKGSHQTFTRGEQSITVPDHPDLRKGTKASIIRELEPV